MIKNAAIFASGNGSNFQSLVDYAKNGEIDISVKILVCNNKDAYVINRARENGIEVLLIDYSENSILEIESTLIRRLKELEIDYIFLAGFLKKLSPLIISAFRNKIINIHPSMLPKYKGLHAIKQALDNGDKEIGVTVHYVDEKIDNGPIILQDLVCVDGLNEEDVYKKVHQLEHRLYAEAIRKILIYERL